MHQLTLVFLIALSLGIIIELWLSFRQGNHVLNNKDAVPNDFAGKISLTDHQTAARYTLTKLNIEKLQIFISPLILLFWTLGGGIASLDQYLLPFGLSELAHGIALILCLMLISSLIDLPISLWNTFKIEAAFGFNKMTIKQFVSDMGLQFLLSLIIGIPIIAGILSTMQFLGEYWWFTAWILWMSFTLFITWAFPTYIAPLFNKFSPLEDESLKARLETLLTRCGFSSDGMFVMDGSKRSAHGNAYFTGFGDNKRIVFFDTLLKGLKEDEVEAVLAHELGHFKHKHILKSMILMSIMSLAGLALLGWLEQQAWFFTALGVDRESSAAALLLFMLVLPVFTQFMTPLMSALSRKHEFEADAYAAEQTNAESLINGLVSMYRDNASTLTPDPLYSAFHHSHPPAMVRIQHLSSTMKTSQ